MFITLIIAINLLIVVFNVFPVIAIKLRGK
jgi:hypothetical protein